MVVASDSRHFYHDPLCNTTLYWFTVTLPLKGTCGTKPCQIKAPQSHWIPSLSGSSIQAYTVLLHMQSPTYWEYEGSDHITSSLPHICRAVPVVLTPLKSQIWIHDMVTSCIDIWITWGKVPTDLTAGLVALVKVVEQSPAIRAQTMNPPTFWSVFLYMLQSMIGY